MEGGNDSKAATTRLSESKMSYSQAAKITKPKLFFREINYSIGVVEKIHRTRENAYARVSVGKGEELSLKISPNTQLRPGDFVKVTLEQSGGKAFPTLYGAHSEPIPPEMLPLCRGRVKWFDRGLRSWSVKVRSSAKYLRIQHDKQSKLKPDQIIFFVPTFSEGKMGIAKVVEYQGGTDPGTPATWTLPSALAARLDQESEGTAFVRPTTRSDQDAAPQLDIKAASEALPPNSEPLYSLPYLQLEELYVRQKFTPGAWAKDPHYQSTLALGVKPIFYVGDDEPQKIRQIQNDIKSIQKSGLSRSIRVVYPAPPFVNAASVKTTMATKLVNPSIFPITSVRLFDHPCPVTRTRGSSTKILNQRLLVISMDTKGGDPDFPVTTDARPILDELQAPSAQTRSEIARQNLLVLVRKDDTRLALLRTQRPNGCHVRPMKHPCHRLFASLLLTFGRPSEAEAYVQANRCSSRPLFMQTAARLHHESRTAFVTTTKLLPPAKWNLRGLGDVYPVHQTKYAVFFTGEASALIDHLQDINNIAAADGKQPVFRHILVEGRAQPLTATADSALEGKDSDQISQVSKQTDTGTKTLVATGFPIYAPANAITKAVAALMKDKSPPPAIGLRPTGDYAVAFTANQSQAEKLAGRSFLTALGSIAVRVLEPGEDLPSPSQ